MANEPDGVAPSNRVVVGMDLSTSALYALSLALDMIRPMAIASELHVVHVVTAASFRGAFGEGHVRPTPEHEPAFDPKRRPLEELCFEVSKATRARVALYMTFGDPTLELVRIASAVGANLIVVGCGEHGRWRFHRSLAARLAVRAPCSVLVARTPESHAEAPYPHQRERERPASDGWGLRM